MIDDHNKNINRLNSVVQRSLSLCALCITIHLWILFTEYIRMNYIIILFGAQIVPNLAHESIFWLTSAAFWHYQLVFGICLLAVIRKMEKWKESTSLQKNAG